MIYLKVLAIIALVLTVSCLFFFTQADRGLIFNGGKNIDYNGTKRHYRIAKPSSEIKKIVVGLHGLGDSSRGFAYYSGLHNLTDENTLVVYPDAVNSYQANVKKGWNAGFCCGSGFVNDLDDSGYLMYLIESLKKQFELTETTVYITGFSNGGFMAGRMASEYAGYFNAVAVMAGSVGANGKFLSPQEPIPILLMHGKQDASVPFEGGVGGSDSDFTWPSFAESVEFWKNNNQDQAETKVVVNDQDAHKWHDWRLLNFWHSKPDGSRQVIDFFESTITSGP